MRISLQWNFFTLLWILFQCPGLCLLDHLLVRHDSDLHTAIQGTSLSGAVVGNRLMNTFALEVHTIRTDALVHQLIINALRPFLRQGLVVIYRTRIVRMTDDLDIRIRIGLQTGTEVTQGTLRSLTYRTRVGSEQNT